ncbi:MAG: serine/threonine-protein phosphatase [Deltaproteobacteria bacterium]|nr:serine/threonine-protein phosphatase [Deltaproteobacteria bacterium]MBW2253787.1 serine/threonine-protein phosphatase [Deltaproteobacteria bacterium]
MHLECYARTDPGPIREHNEDAFLVDQEYGVFIVADGMGGHAAGEVASSMAVEIVRDLLVDQEDPEETRLVREVEPVDPADILRERLRYAMNQASILIRRESELRPETRGMGTTVVVLVVEGEQAHFAHVGDSRAYLFRDGRLVRLTRDHTVVQQEIDAGRLTPELARLVPHKHILTQSVGFHGPVEPDTTTRMIQSGDVFILCSDGLTDPLDDEAILEVVHAMPVDMLADALAEAALEAGGEDNVTVVTVAASD